MFVSSRSELSEFRRRYRWMKLFVVLSFVVLMARLVQLQIVDGDDHHQQSLANVIRNDSIPAVRGRVFDNKGRVVATSMPAHAVVVTPHYFDMGDGFEKLVEFLGYDEEKAEGLRDKLKERLLNPKDMRRFQQITVAADITPEQLATIKVHQDELPGVSIQDVPVRHYPYGSLSSHLVGYMNEVNPNDMERLLGTVEDKYRSGDRIGRNGIERSMEAELRGVRGWRKKVVDARGLPITGAESEGLLPEPRMQEPQSGHDITLTIDMSLQKIVKQALRGHLSGAAVVLDVDTGRVLAATSKPSYDSNLLTKGLTYEQHQALNEDPFRPRIDKAVYENYYPGSTFKPFSAMAALEEGRITADDVFHCSGYHELGRRTFTCPKPHGDLTLSEALTKSCNVYFYNLAEMTGMDTIARYAGEFGFGERTGVGYNSEAPGFLPTKAWYAEKFPGKFRIGHTLNASIGQGNVKATVMQVAVAYAVIANGGTVYEPQVIRRIETFDGDLVKDFVPVAKRRVAVSQRSLDLVMNSLGQVVSDEDGTAHNIDNDEVLLAGKTGTAQVPKRKFKRGDDLNRHYYLNRSHAWFAAVAPADNPEIAVVVLIEHGGAGGENAAPVVAEITRRYYKEIAPRQEVPLIADKTPKKKDNLPIVVDDSETTAASSHRR